MKRVAAFLILLCTSVLNATVINVPADQPTIQAGINAATDGDTVSVALGVYVENIVFGGKRILLIAPYGSDATVIEPSNPNLPIVSFSNGEDTTAIIDGFQICNTTNARGVYCQGSSPIVRNCEVFNCNYSGSYGGGIFCLDSGAKLRDNRIHGNSCISVGGGIGGYGNHAELWEITGNIIYGNSSEHGPGLGFTPGSRNALISRNIVYENQGSAGGLSGGIYTSGQGFVIANNTVVGNTKGITISGSGADIRNNIVVQNVNHGLVSSTSTYDYNCVWGNGSDNTTGPNGISLDPEFADSVSHDFRLLDNSPCIDAGDPSPIYNDPDGTRNDIGAHPFEYFGSILYVPSDYSFIQEAIDSASYYDTVLVSAGVYEECIRIANKSIKLIAETGPEFTTLGRGISYYVVLRVDSSRNVLVEGFTLTRVSYGTDGIEISNSSNVVIENCALIDCSWEDAAIEVRGSSHDVLIKGCRFSENPASFLIQNSVSDLSIDSNLFENNSGRILWVSNGIPKLRFSRNSVQHNSVLSTGLINFLNGLSSDSLQISENTFFGNSIGQKGLITLENFSGVTIGNNIFAHNDSDYDIYVIGTDSISATCCDFWQNTSSGFYGPIRLENSLSVNPRFCDTTVANLSLAANSPCLPENNDCGVLIGASPQGCDSIASAFHVSVDGSDIDGDGSESSPFETIQNAINESSDGDSVIAHDGVYYERITFDGKQISLGSLYMLDGDTNHILNTIVDGDTLVTPLESDTGSVVRLVNGEDSTSALIGLTIQNGIGIDGHGGGMYIDSSTATVRCCRFVSNTVTVDGGAIYGHGRYSSPLLSVSDCEFTLNSATNGSAILWMGPDVRIVRSTFVLNSCIGFTVSTDSVGSDVELRDCTISNNQGGGVSFVDNDDVEVRANCIDFNTGIGLRLSENDWSEGYNAAVVGNSICGNGETGAVLAASSSAAVVMDSCTICQNAGTGVSISNNMAVDIYRSAFELNGDHAIRAGNTLRFIKNCRFVANTTSSPHGGAISIPVFSKIDSCLFAFNSADDGGAIRVHSDKQLDLRQPFRTISNCTFFGNESSTGTISLGAWANTAITNCIFSGGIGSQAIYIDGGSGIGLGLIACTNIFGNEGGDWVGPIADQLDSNGNMSADPWFCDTTSSECTLMDISPCAPANNDCGVLIGAMPVACTGMPNVETFSIPAESDLSHILHHTPEFYWSFLDPIAAYQDSFEIGVGTDDDWEFSEKWNPARFPSSDTSIVYDGSALNDGETSWARLRMHNGYVWSDWYEISFRMNSLPSLPGLDSPIAGEVVSNSLPELVLSNSIDPDSDSIRYTIEISPDSFMSQIDEYQVVAESGETTTFTIPSALDEDAQYWWRAKASDYYEETAFTGPSSFWVNTTNTVPSAFDLIDPPDTSGGPVASLAPTFSWTVSDDPDPQDSVLYDLHIAVDSSFTFVNMIYDIPDTFLDYPDSLSWDTRYWWRILAHDQNAGETWSSNVLSFRTVTLGDADSSGGVDVDDVVYLINYIFSSGPAPVPLFAGDADCSSAVDVDDVVYLIAYIFAGGPDPCF